MYVYCGAHHIKPQYHKDFIEAIIENSVGSVNEPGCYRLDIIQDTDDPNWFYLYQLYQSQKVHEVDHVQTPHVRKLLALPKWNEWHSWRPTRIHGKNVSPDDAGMGGTPLKPLPTAPSKKPPYLFWGTWQIKPEHREAYIKGMSANARGSVDNEPGCYRYDVIQDQDDPNRFYLYEVFEDRDAHDVAHVGYPHLKELLEDPAWPTWPVDGWKGTRIDGDVVWSHDSWKK